MSLPTPITAIGTDTSSSAYSAKELSQARIVKMFTATTKEEAIFMGFFDKFLDWAFRRGEKHQVLNALYDTLNLSDSSSQPTGSVLALKGHYDLDKYNNDHPELRPHYLYSHQMFRIWALQNSMTAENKNAFTVSFEPSSIEGLDDFTRSKHYSFILKLNNRQFVSARIKIPNLLYDDVDDNYVNFLKCAAFNFAFNCRNLSSEQITPDLINIFSEMVGGIGLLSNSKIIHNILNMVTLSDDKNLKNTVLQGIS